jgi:non-canonical purine NTP pyrophosphatase (RdgB/HAM1 family)
MIKFITGNKAKVKEAQAVLAPIKILPVSIDLDEIQEVDPKKIITHKLKEALKHQKGPLVVDDSSLFFSCFNYKLPGPLIKWFNDYVGMKGLVKMAKGMGDTKARATTIIGYAESPNKILFFEGTLKGKIVEPRGHYGFGYDQIFQPEGKKQTLSEMKEQKNFFYSPRAIALEKFKKYLKTNHNQK